MSLDMLHEVLVNGTAKQVSSYGLSGYYVGKTGTTNSGRDTWFVGTDADMSVAVWVGFDKNKVVGLTGGKVALPIWARFMSAVAGDAKKVSPPSSIEQKEVCADAPKCETLRKDWFLSSVEGEQRCSLWSDSIFDKEPFWPNLMPWAKQKKGDE